MTNQKQFQFVGSFSYDECIGFKQTAITMGASVTHYNENTQRNMTVIFNDYNYRTGCPVRLTVMITYQGMDKYSVESLLCEVGLQEPIPHTITETMLRWSEELHAYVDTDRLSAAMCIAQIMKHIKNQQKRIAEIAFGSSLLTWKAQ